MSSDPTNINLLRAQNAQEIAIWIFCRTPAKATAETFLDTLDWTLLNLKKDRNMIRNNKKLRPFLRSWKENFTQLILFGEKLRQVVKDAVLDHEEHCKLYEHRVSAEPVSQAQIMQLAYELDESIFGILEVEKYNVPVDRDTFNPSEEKERPESPISPVKILKSEECDKYVATSVQSILGKIGAQKSTSAEEIEYFLKQLDIQEKEDNSDSKEKEEARDEIMSRMIYSKEIHFNNPTECN